MIDGFFDVVRSEPVIKPEALFIPEFKALWEADKSKTKELATRQLCYIYHSVSPFSAYAKLDPIEKDLIVRGDFLKDSDDESELLTLAKNKYHYLFIESDVDMELIQGVTEALRKIGRYLQSVEIMDGKGGNVREINAAIKDAALMKSQRDALIKQVQEGIEAQKRIKKNVRPNIFDED